MRFVPIQKITVGSFEELNNYLRVIVNNLNVHLSNADLVIPLRHAAPNKVYDGLTVLADGTDWNPGGGQGVYTYYAGTWNKLG
jgi:hypothetical protein